MKLKSAIRWSLVIVLVVLDLQDCNCFKVLFVFPIEAKSHFTGFIVLAEELARRGHDVTVVSFFPQENTNYREIILDPKEPNESDANATESSRCLFCNFFRGNKIIQAQGEELLRDENFRRLIVSKENYDVVLGEIGMGDYYQPCIAALGHTFTAPFISMSSRGLMVNMLRATGNPLSLSYYPNENLPANDQMSFWERVHNTGLGLVHLLAMNWYFMPAHEALVQKYLTNAGVKSLPPLSAMIENISLSLVNTHFSTGYPRPLAPNVIEVGGMHLKPVKKLPQNLQKFMDGAEHGVIYLSFGSVFREEHLGQERVLKIAASLKRLQQRVIIKWGDPTPFQDAKNILVVSWIPQQDLLAHPKLLLFITHGGYTSLMEVVRAGVPVLVIPIFDDQIVNAAFYESRGIGKKLNLDTFTADELYDSIVHVIETPSFKENVKEISRRMLDRPRSALDTAVFWVEYVVRHRGAHHLKPASVSLPLYQYLLLDILAALALVIFIVVKLICMLCCLRSSTKREGKTAKKTN